jgi:hypothetical protein
VRVPGPILIFDKSALQDLSDDEAFLLDAFFLTNIVPTFFVEVLGDLAKESAQGVESEQLVGALAEKTPRHNALVSAFHGSLLIADLLGKPIEMNTGQIVLDRGSMRRAADGAIGYFVEEPPEADALWRWQSHEFTEVERLYSRSWRASLSAIDHGALIEWAERMVPPTQRIRTLQDARAFADGFVSSGDRQVLEFVLQHLNVDARYRRAILERHAALGFAPLATFAPYAAHIFTVNVMLALGMSTLWISSKPQNNVVDASYLYYLPFCMVFASGDKLHARLVPHLKRENQEFVWGPDLRAALRELHAYYVTRRVEIGAAGPEALPFVPPTDVDNLVTRLWDQFLAGWRERAQRKSDHVAQEGPDVVMRTRGDGEELPENEWPAQPDFLVVKKRVPPQRGHWRITQEPSTERRRSDTD